MVSNSQGSVTNIVSEDEYNDIFVPFRIVTNNIILTK